MCPPIRPLRAFGQHGRTIRVRRWVMTALSLLILGFRLPGALAATPANTLTIGIHVSLAPTWFDPAEDVKFSFGRYRGAGSSLMRERVKSIEIVRNSPGPTLGFSHIGSIEGFVYTAPYEDLTLKGG